MNRSHRLAARLLAGAALIVAPAALAQAPAPTAQPPVTRAPMPTPSAMPSPPAMPMAPRSTATTVGETPDSGTMKRADKEDMRLVLTKLMELGVKPIDSRSVEEARRQPSPADAVKAVLKDQGKDPAALMAAMKVSKKDLTYPTGGSTQPVRIYAPEGASGPLPVIVYYHGGGWVIADIDTYEASAMALAKKVNAIVASVEYRRAPENKFPAAHEDAFEAYKWVLANAGSFGGDPARVALAGESAGGNLAANVAIMARDAKVQAPLHMLLVYPVAGTDTNTASYVTNQNAVPLSKGGIMWFLGHVLAKPEDATSPMLNLTTKADLKGLPPATIVNAEIDPLETDGKLLADALTAAGVPVKRQVQAGVTHEFFGMDAVLDDARRAQAFAVEELKEAFASRPTGSTAQPTKAP